MSTKTANALTRITRIAANGSFAAERQWKLAGDNVPGKWEMEMRPEGTLEQADFSHKRREHKGFSNREPHRIREQLQRQDTKIF
jgi:hypothetical protein